MQRNYDEAKKRFTAAPESFAAAWQFGRACFDRAEFSHGSAERAGLANEGIAASRKAISANSNSACGHYYLALNFAQLARTKMWGAIPLVPQMEQGWLTALSLDAGIDYAGPDRYVGLLYRDAPGWPVSIGDKAKARAHLLHAVEVSPGFPENYLNLIETYLGWNETAHAAAALEKLRPLLPEARKKFTGEYWDESWKDWDQRLEKIQNDLGSRPRKQLR